MNVIRTVLSITSSCIGLYTVGRIMGFIESENEHNIKKLRDVDYFASIANIFFAFLIAFSYLDIDSGGWGRVKASYSESCPFVYRFILTCIVIIMSVIGIINRFGSDPESKNTENNETVDTVELESKKLIELREFSIVASILNLTSLL